MGSGASVPQVEQSSDSNHGLVSKARNLVWQQATQVLFGRRSLATDCKTHAAGASIICRRGGVPESLCIIFVIRTCGV